MALLGLAGCGGGSGSSGPTEGPTAAITVTEGHSITLGTTLHVSGASSVPLAGRGPIVEYDWECGQPPHPGSVLDAFANAAPTGHVVFEQATFTPTVAGVYTLYLRVWDATGPSVTFASYVVTVS
jgi:hypothetical protein